MDVGRSFTISFHLLIRYFRFEHDHRLGTVTRPAIPQIKLRRNIYPHIVEQIPLFCLLLYIKHSLVSASHAGHFGISIVHVYIMVCKMLLLLLLCVLHGPLTWRGFSSCHLIKLKQNDHFCKCMTDTVTTTNEKLIDKLSCNGT